MFVSDLASTCPNVETISSDIMGLATLKPLPGNAHTLKLFPSDGKMDREAIEGMKFDEVLDDGLFSCPFMNDLRIVIVAGEVDYEAWNKAESACRERDVQLTHLTF